MRITQWGEFGIQFSAYIARRTIDGYPIVGAAEIAYAQNVDLQYAQQILQRLRKGGIINSVRGPSGGYRLVKNASEFTLYDILCATEGMTLEVFPDAEGAPTGYTAIMRDFKHYMDTYLRNCPLEALARMPEYAYRESSVSASLPHNHSLDTIAAQGTA